MRSYDPSLLEDLAHPRHAYIDGLDVLVKPVPDDSRPHALDLRVLAYAQARIRRSTSSSASPTGSHIDPSPVRGECRPASSRRSLRSTRFRSDRVASPVCKTRTLRQECLVEGDDRLIDVLAWRPANKPLGPLPVLVYLHGGGFTAGDATWFEDAMALISDASGCAVVFPEYRLTPEAPFPAAIDD